MEIRKMSEMQDKNKSVKMVIFGNFGIGKTSLLKTLDEPTICLDFEAGLLSVQDWDGDAIPVQTWEEARDLCCLICGPNPMSKQAYSQKHYEYCVKKYPFAENLKQYKSIFIDSITVASRLCLEYAKSIAEIAKNGKPDIRSAYGTLATEMLTWINNFQHLEGIDVIFVGGLDQKLDDYNRVIYTPQVEGSKVAAELPGILDEVITMAQIQGKRRFICQTLNPDGHPAKDRSGKLNLTEDADLGQLLRKIKNKTEKMQYELAQEVTQIDEIMQQIKEEK